MSKDKGTIEIEELKKHIAEKTIPPGKYQKILKERATPFKWPEPEKIKTKKQRKKWVFRLYRPGKWKTRLQSNS